MVRNFNGIFSIHWQRDRDQGDIESSISHCGMIALWLWSVLFLLLLLHILDLIDNSCVCCVALLPRIHWAWMDSPNRDSISSSKDISRTSNRTEIFFGDDDDVAEWLGNLFFAIPYVVANRIESTAGKFYYRSMVAADKSCKPGPAISYCHLKKPHLTPQSVLVGGC